MLDGFLNTLQILLGIGLAVCITLETIVAILLAFSFSVYTLFLTVPLLLVYVWAGYVVYKMRR